MINYIFFLHFNIENNTTSNKINDEDIIIGYEKVNIIKFKKSAYLGSNNNKSIHKKRKNQKIKKYIIILKINDLTLNIIFKKYKK